MESIKNRERKSNRFTLCFKPVDMKDGGGGGTKVCADNRVSAINADDSVVVVGDDDYNDSRIVPVTSSGLSDEGLKVSVSVSVSDEVVVGKMKKRTKLSRIVKAVFFETSLARKIIRNKKSRRKNLLRSSSNISTNSDKNSNSTDDKLSPRVSSSSDEDNNNHNKNQRTNSSFSSSVTSGTTTTFGLSNSSSMALSSRSMSERKASSFRSNLIELKKQREDCWNYGLCLLLVSMLVLILWGKVCAIFCTSAWLFFVPRRNSIGHGSSEIGVGLPEEVDSVQYKKKVIMEGLLGRNRTRVP